MTRRAGFLFVAVMVSAVVSGCASSGVRIMRSDQSETSVVTEASTVGSGSDPTPPTSPATVAWSPCADYEAPYECGSMDVPLDYSRADDTQISLALIRLPATDSSSRIGSLILYPGGPGGSGISLVYNEGDTFPADVLARFDIVGFDPRGVGASSAVACPSSFDADKDSYDDCIGPNLDVLPFLGTSNVARDLDRIRAAVGDAQLSYLGYSYGSALGAVYADMFPNRIRAMVLDGAVDPDAGLSNTSAGGSDFYADQDFDGTIAVFEDLCDATPACVAGPHTRQLVDRLGDEVRDLPTTSFANAGRFTRGDLDDLMANAMYSSFDWPILAIALHDADNGDASTLAALSSWLLYGYPADRASEVAEEFSNIAVRCADFSNRGAGSFDCANFPKTEDSLPAITAVDTPTPIVVIGTKDDPATPARYAPRMAAALGDAVSIEWQGAGHTATLTSQCITDIVAKYLIDTIAPADGTTCPFVSGATTVTEQADAVFGVSDPEMSSDALEDVLVASGESDEIARCVADELAKRGTERLVVHELLGVESPELVSLRGEIEAGCRGGG